MVEVSDRVENGEVALEGKVDNVQTVALFNTATSELVSFSFTLDDVFDRARWDDVSINRKIIELKKRA